MPSTQKESAVEAVGPRLAWGRVLQGSGRSTHPQRRIEEVVINYSLLFTFTPHASLLLPNPTECR
jgi:hypothetical protein